MTWTPAVGDLVRDPEWRAEEYAQVVAVDGPFMWIADGPDDPVRVEIEGCRWEVLGNCVGRPADPAMVPFLIVERRRVTVTHMTEG